MITPIIFGDAYPLHAAAIDCARGWGANLVRRGIASQAAVGLALSWMVRARQAEDFGPAETAVCFALATSVSEATVAAALADQDVSKAVGPHLAAKATPGTVRRAGRAASAGRLDPDELEAVLRREASWWLRRAEQAEVHHAEA